MIGLGVFPQVGIAFSPERRALDFPALSLKVSLDREVRQLPEEPAGLAVREEGQLFLGLLRIALA